MREIKKVTEQILTNLAKGVKIVNFLAMEGPNRGRGPPLGYSMGFSSSWLIDNVLTKLYA